MDAAEDAWAATGAPFPLADIPKPVDEVTVTEDQLTVWGQLANEILGLSPEALSYRSEETLFGDLFDLRVALSDTAEIIVRAAEDRWTLRDVYHLTEDGMARIQERLEGDAQALLHLVVAVRHLGVTV